MKNKQIEFDLTEAEEATAFANVCRSLNAAGVPYHTANSAEHVTIFIGDGY
jgi:hypothetical protein